MLVNEMDFRIVLSAVTFLILFSGAVFAIPGVPHQFYGYVTWNGQPAPDGSTIVAKINNVEVARTTSLNGKYGYDSIFFVDDTNNDRTGKTIRFLVNDADTGQTAVFCNGCSTYLNLTASGGQQTRQGGTTTGGGTTGGNIGTTERVANITNQTTQTTNQTPTQPPQKCQERWSCSEWSKCQDGLQTRTCNDLNKCGTEEDKPLESQPCTTVTPAFTPASSPLAPITGMIVAVTQNPLYLSLLVIVIVGGVIALFRIRTKRIQKVKKKRK